MKLNKLLTSTACVLSLAGGALAATFTGVDIGTPSLPGSSTVNGDGTITIKGSGDDIWNAADSCQYYYTSVQGLVWDAVVRVQSLAAINNWTKCELMVRQDDGTGVPKAADPFIGDMATAVTLTDGTTAAQNVVADQFRPTRAANADGIDNNPVVRPTYPNTWLRIQRNGSVFTVQYGSDGSNWNTYITIDTAKAASDNGGTRGFDGNAWKDPILVGVAVTSHDNSGLATAVVSDLSVTVHPLQQAPSVLKAKKDVQSVSTTSGNPVGFTFVATNNAIPSVPVAYQWYKNNQVVSNVSGTTYSFLSTDADNGAKVYCTATMPAWDNPNNVAALYSSTGTVTLAPANLYTNGLKREVFMGANRTQVEQGTAGLPGAIYVRTNFVMPVNDGINNYAQRVSGWFIPPLTTNYNFFVCADDDADLFISTDNTAGHLQLVAQETAWSNPGEWINSSGNSNIGQKRSDQFSPDGGGTYPFSGGISLVAGHLYYLQGVHHQGTGGDNFSVLYSIYGEVEPTNDTPCNLTATNKNIVFATGPSTTLQISQQPQSELIYDQQTAFFSVGTTSDSELTPYFQWYRDGQPVAGATSSSYSFVASTKTDNGAKFFVTANSEIGGLWATSQVATLTVQSAILEVGFVKVEKAPAAEPTEAQIQTGDIGTVTQTYAHSIFEADVPGNEDGDNYGKRISGYFIPPSSGTYSFITCSDDNSALFLSTDDTPAKKVWIAYETAWSNPLLWNTASSGNLAQKQSDSFVNPNTQTAPYPNGIPLVGGQKYYIEVDEREGGGGDNVAVTYYKTGTTPPADQTPSALTGSVIAMQAPRCSYVAFTSQPQSVAVNPAGTASFSADGITDSTIPVGGSGPTIMTNFLIFQWTKNGVNIPGATASTYTTAPEGPWDNGAAIACKMRALGLADTNGTPVWSNSQPATLTINGDPTAPAITHVGYYIFTNLAGVGETYVTVEFNKVMDPTTLAVPGNYSIPGLTVTGITVNSNNYSSVKLTVSGTPTFPVNLTISGIKDGWGTVPATSTAAVGRAGLISQDIGTPASGTANDDPVFPSTMWVDDTNAYTVVCEGSDIWNAFDGCNFAYEVRTGDFDVAVRHKSITHTSNWAKGGLMVRESLSADSRNWNIVNDPRSSDGIQAPDNSGFGANITECNWRTNGVGSGATSTGWAIIPQTNTPAYPNAWLRLTRKGTLLTGSYASDGINWTVLGAYDVKTNADNPTLPDTLYVGICTTAHNNDSPTTTSPLYWNTSQYADYMSVYVPPTPPATATMSLSKQGNNWVITFSPYLYSATSVNGTYTKMNVTSPYTIPTGSGTMQFYRAGTQ